jgi:hypothetical protein
MHVIPAHIREKIKREVLEENAKDWAELKRITDAMSDHRFVSFWYDLEILNAWYRYYSGDDKVKYRMSRRCKSLMEKGTDNMVGAAHFRFYLLEHFKDPAAGKASFLKWMFELHKNAILHGTTLGIRVGAPMLSTKNILHMRPVREELIRRFEERPASPIDPTS